MRSGARNQVRRILVERRGVGLGPEEDPFPRVLWGEIDR